MNSELFFDFLNLPALAEPDEHESTLLVENLPRSQSITRSFTHAYARELGDLLAVIGRSENVVLVVDPMEQVAIRDSILRFLRGRSRLDVEIVNPPIDGRNPADGLFGDIVALLHQPAPRSGHRAIVTSSFEALSDAMPIQEVAAHT